MYTIRILCSAMLLLASCSLQVDMGRGQASDPSRPMVLTPQEKLDAVLGVLTPAAQTTPSCPRTARKFTLPRKK